MSLASGPESELPLEAQSGRHKMTTMAAVSMCRVCRRCGTCRVCRTCPKNFSSFNTDRNILHNKDSMQLAPNKHGVNCNIPADMKLTLKSGRDRTSPFSDEPFGKSNSSLHSGHLCRQQQHFNSSRRHKSIHPYWILLLTICALIGNASSASIKVRKNLYFINIFNYNIVILDRKSGF